MDRCSLATYTTQGTGLYTGPIPLEPASALAVAKIKLANATATQNRKTAAE